VSDAVADRLRVAVGLDARHVALAALGLLTLSYGSVLYHVTDVVGGSELMLAALVGPAALALVVGRVLRVRTAVGLTALLLAGGVAVYFVSVPATQRALLSPDRLLSDTVALLTGLSVLRLTQANVWALSVAPAPVFLSWYLAVRRRYVWSAACGGTALSLVVLTGDAGTVTTLAGVVAAAGLVGFGTLDRHDGMASQADTLVVLLVVMVVAATTLSVAAPARGGPVLPDRSSSTTGVASFADTGDSVRISGAISLSTQEQFTVESPRRSYLTTGTYDRYTGSGWVRSGDTRPYAGQLDDPTGEGNVLRQTVTATTELGSMPAAWRPVSVDGIADSRVRVTSQGSIRPTTTLDPGESYTVTSRVVDTPKDDEGTTSPEYPDGLRETYTRLPASTPSRVEARADAVTADAETPVAKARAVETHLESTKRYSLSVDRPEGNVADAFLFEMDAGYCTYFATAMVVLLRAEDVPARFVTGYTPSERDDGEFVVRGLDSHAWVQVYLPDEGWVRFDPTPTVSREAAEQARLADAGVGDPADDTAANDSPTPTPDGADATPTATPPGGPNTPGAVGDSGAGAGPQTGSGPTLPSRSTLAFWGVVLIGLGAALRRTGAVRRLRRAVWLRRRGPRRDPDTDATRAFDRLAYLLERRERPRRPGETPRAYVRSLTTDPRARRVLTAYERARYGDGVDRDTADDALDAVDELVRERALPWRLRDR